jgi:hypothetical protein
VFGNVTLFNHRGCNGSLGAPARKIEFVEPFQSDFTCPVPIEKIFRFARRANHLYKPAPSRLTRGAARDRHRRRDGMRWTQAALLTRARILRTAKSCGPDIPTLMSSWRQCYALRWRRRQQSPVSGASTKETVKTIARGMPGVSGVTVVTNSCAFYTLRARLRAHQAPGIPCAL